MIGTEKTSIQFAKIELNEGLSKSLVP